MLEYAQKYKKMREVGKYTTECLDRLANVIQSGISTKDIDDFVITFQEEHKLKNAQFGYVMGLSPPFPGHCCTSINEIVCHGIPSEQDILNDGDIIAVDITFILDGYYGDACRTYYCGPGSGETENAVNIRTAAKTALNIACQQCKPGSNIGSIGQEIEKYIDTWEDFSVVKSLYGHGIGTKFHTFPSISHFNDPNNPTYEMPMVPGMIFTIEPIIIATKKPRLRYSDDGWSISAGSISAQYEATVGITEDGYEIFAM